MAERKVGTVAHWQNLSSTLAIFRLLPENGSKFPYYKAGQYIALRREDCKLTKKSAGSDGQIDYVPDLDEQGNQKRGPVTHSYSVSSAPVETSEKGFLEFYIVLEKDEHGNPGRLTESLFRINPQGDNTITYVDRIVGDFTLEKRAAGFQSVLLVGTGTGLAPFASMIKQLHFEASQGKTDGVKYTLLHTNRTYDELAYHEELLAIEASQVFDFVYVSSVSRPTPRDLDDQKIGRGRANNLLRFIFEMPLKEEEALEETGQGGGDVSRARAALEKAVRPKLPQHVSRKELRERFDPSRTVILTCGNPLSMDDIKYITEANRIHFEKEDW
jgi:ferredoxin-NADP reductase